MNPTRDTIDAELIDEGALVVRSSDTLAAISAAELDQQIVTAKRFPRSIQKVLDEAKDLATMSKDIAMACTYCLKRGGKEIEGPSVRLAEIVANCYGNLRVDAQIIDIDDKMVVAQATCFDVQKNVIVRMQSRRRITDRQGKRYNDDMIIVTANAAQAIAFREAVFHCVPRSLVDQVYQHAMHVGFEEGVSIEEHRNKALAFLKTSYKVTPEQVYALLDIKGEAELTRNGLRKLHGICQAIKDGDTTAEQQFSFKSPDEKAKAMTERVEQSRKPPEKTGDA